MYLPFYSDDTTEDNDADELLELRYHKYKLEYCSLKIKQSGGAAKYIVMAVSHYRIMLGFTGISICLCTFLLTLCMQSDSDVIQSYPLLM